MCTMNSLSTAIIGLKQMLRGSNHPRGSEDALEKNDFEMQFSNPFLIKYSKLTHLFGLFGVPVFLNKLEVFHVENAMVHCIKGLVEAIYMYLLRNAFRVFC